MEKRAHEIDAFVKRSGTESFQYKLNFVMLLVWCEKIWIFSYQMIQFIIHLHLLWPIKSNIGIKTI